MSEATARADIHDVLLTVDQIGEVHSYERLVTDWSKFLDLFKSKDGGTDQIRGCMLAYRGFDPEIVGAAGCDLRHHRFTIFHFLSINDEAETEKDAAALAEDICNKLDRDPTLRGIAYYGRSPATLSVFEPRMFGGVLCHYSEISKVVAEEFNWTA